MTDDAVAGADAAVGHTEEEEEQPRGTLLLLALFIGLIAAMWLWTYFTLLGRS